MLDNAQDATLSAKQVDVVLTLAQDGFGQNGAETITLSGYCIHCQITSTGLESGMACTLRVEGLAQPLLNQLSVLQTGMAAQTRNTVTILAGQSTGQGAGQKPVVFYGGVVEAFVDYANSPDVAFELRAFSGALPAAVPVAPTSFAQDVPVVTIMQLLAAKAGLDFTNYGVQTLLRGGVYYKGSVAEQVDSCARAARIAYQIGVGALAIWPGAMVAQADAQAIRVNVQTGLVGYPSYSQYGVVFQTVFNPSIRYRDTVCLQTGTAALAAQPTSTQTVAGQQPAQGALTQDALTQGISTQGQSGQGQGARASGVMVPASGLWVVQNVRHDLQTERPGGAWFTTVEAARPDFAGQAFAR
ncbi:baseplate hub protein [Acetobacter syzygii]|uniref:baseplate hub protein n=1 Tax=Acetobacter syzygii TaxID=146476 RepID=UPI0039ED4DAB